MLSIAYRHNGDFKAKILTNYCLGKICMHVFRSSTIVNLPETNATPVPMRRDSHVTISEIQKVITGQLLIALSRGIQSSLTWAQINIYTHPEERLLRSPFNGTLRIKLYQSKSFAWLS